MNIRKGLLSAFALMFLLTADASDVSVGRQSYPVAPEKAETIRETLKHEQANMPEKAKNDALVWYIVPALSSEIRGHDTIPTDGTAWGELELVMAQGEYDSVSFMALPFRDVSKLNLTVRFENEETPAGFDWKTVKLWYQSGNAWQSHFQDSIQRVLIPELLLHDESLIYADTSTRDNYVRYEYPDGRREYVWMSFSFPLVAYGKDCRAKTRFIRDAETFAGAVLNRGELKQFHATVHVPTGTKPGLYRGAVELSDNGVKLTEIPVKLHVLPFELPAPRTNYDLNKEFYVTLYGFRQEEKIMRNLARHNARHSIGSVKADPDDPDVFRKSFEALKRTGLGTDRLFAISPIGVHQMVVDESNPTPAELAALKEQKENLRKIKNQFEGVIDPGNVFFYGADEGKLRWTKRQRTAWRQAHGEGFRVMVSARPIPRRQYALDFMVLSGAPIPERAQEVLLFHEAVPDSMVGWYADPHTGPENPDYMRRLHGMQAWKFNYDAISNYVFFRNDWNDFASNLYEPFLRGLMLVYPTADDVLDTLAWEGVREGVDDVRYASKLKMLCMEALKHKEVSIRLTARQNLAFLAYSDFQRTPLDAWKAETVNRILILQNLLKGNNQ